MGPGPARGCALDRAGPRGATRGVRHRYYVLPAEQLRSMLGIASVEVRVGDKPLAITDTTLAE